MLSTGPSEGGMSDTYQHAPTVALDRETDALEDPFRHLPDRGRLIPNPLSEDFPSQGW